MKRKHWVLLATLILLWGVSSSCISMFVTPLYTKLDFNNYPEGTKIQLFINGKKISEKEAPAYIQVRNQDRLTVRITREGYYPATVVTRKRKNLNKDILSLSLGMFTMFITYGFDYATGALSNIEPNHFDVELEPITGKVGEKKRVRVEFSRVANETLKIDLL